MSAGCQMSSFQSANEFCTSKSEDIEEKKRSNILITCVIGSWWGEHDWFLNHRLKSYPDFIKQFKNSTNQINLRVDTLSLTPNGKIIIQKNGTEKYASFDLALTLHVVFKPWHPEYGGLCSVPEKAFEAYCHLTEPHDARAVTGAMGRAAAQLRPQHEAPCKHWGDPKVLIFPKYLTVDTFRCEPEWSLVSAYNLRCVGREGGHCTL